MSLSPSSLEVANDKWKRYEQACNRIVNTSTYRYQDISPNVVFQITD